MSLQKNHQVPSWIVKFLKFAGFYNMAWGVFILQEPLGFYQLLNGSVDSFPSMLYPFGGGVLILGVLYYLSAQNPIKFQWFILMGLLSKFFGPFIAWAVLASSEVKALNFGLHILFNDLIWLIPLAITFYKVFKEAQYTPPVTNSCFPEILEDYRSQGNESLADLNQKSPLLLVFLRHFGCTFCREALSDIRDKKEKLEAEGTKIVFVHMADVTTAGQYFSNYDLQDTIQISDPSCALYQAFSLRRASFKEVFGLKSWIRGFNAGILRGHGIGKLVGDGFRMPGVFLIYQDQIVKSFIHKQAADIAPYEKLATCEVDARI